MKACFSMGPAWVASFPGLSRRLLALFILQTIKAWEIHVSLGTRLGSGILRSKVNSGRVWGDM